MGQTGSPPLESGCEFPLLIPDDVLFPTACSGKHKD